MKLIIIAASFAALLALTAAVAIAAPGATTTTQNVTVNAASESVIDLPALNSQFTTMTLTGAGTAHWGQGVYPYAPFAGHEYTTSYDANGVMSDGVDATTGIAPGWGPIIAEGTQVGAIVYRIDGGDWTLVNGATTITNPDGGTHKVQVAYNDRPGSYDDNSGSLSLTVVRSK